VIPLELRELPQWLVWRLLQRDGDRKPTKVPFQPDGRPASSTNRATWTSYEKAARANGNFDGIGFVVSADDDLCGADLDDCIKRGKLHPDAAALVLQLNAYTEFSPSGNGVRIFVRGKHNGSRHATSDTPWGGKLEIYDRARFFTVTGNHMPGTPGTVEARQAELDELVARYLPERESAGFDHRPRVLEVDLEDEELLERARQARNGARFDRLWRGETGEYGSRSEADLALCGMLAFWTGGDPGRVDRLFRSSGLWRPKWDSRRGDGTYGTDTISKALRGKTEFWSANPGSDSKSPVRDRSRGLKVTPLSEVTMRSIEWLEKPLWMKSAFQLMAGPKGSGKGTYLAGLAARVNAAGKNVIFVASEDSAEIDLKPRLIASGAEIERCFVIRQHVRLPDHVDDLRRIAREIGNVGMNVIDPVANHIGDRNANNDAEVRDAIAPLNDLANELDCLIVGVRHPGKDRSRGAVASILGSVAWVDTPRAVVMIAEDDEDPSVRHIQVVLGNRAPGGAAQHFRIEAVEVPGLKEPITKAVMLGESAKSVDALLSDRERGESRSGQARELILDILERDGEQESDALDARVAKETSLSARTVQNTRVKLKDDGLVKSFPEKDEHGAVQRWIVSRTQRRDDGFPSRSRVQITSGRDLAKHARSPTHFF
jgi:putative DNA primase/helicase